jgi:hypothetical protein
MTGKMFLEANGATGPVLFERTILFQGFHYELNGNAATVAHSTKKTTSGKDSVIEGQPLLLFM